MSLFSGSSWGGLFDDVECVNEGEEGELNGMPFLEMYGTGEIEGIEVEWSLSLILAQKPIIVLAFA